MGVCHDIANMLGFANHNFLPFLRFVGNTVKSAAVCIRLPGEADFGKIRAVKQLGG
jgi:hypothetical protein